MSRRTLTVLVLGGFWTAVVLGVSLAGCKRGADAQQEDQIDPADLQKQKGKPGPRVDFPARFKTEDDALNQFIGKALDICARGDYDGFRALFGVTHHPMGEAQFARVWEGVERVTVAGVYPDDRRNPPEYYVDVIIDLRKADRKGRTERRGVVWAFREGDEWRIDQAPGEIVHKIRIWSTQPSAGIPTSTRPAGRRRATSRPAASSPSTGQ